MGEPCGRPIFNIINDMLASEQGGGNHLDSSALEPLLVLYNDLI